MEFSDFRRSERISRIIFTAQHKTGHIGPVSCLFMKKRKYIITAEAGITVADVTPPEII